MLTLNLVDKNGKVYRKVAPLNVVLRSDAEVAADSLTVTVDNVLMAQFSYIELYRGAELVFSGEIDEQSIAFDNGTKIKLVARSSAAKLIDNEAYPMSLTSPSAEDIFGYFAKPFGFTCLVGENKEYDGIFTVKKGLSCFEVIKKFSQAVYSSFPRCEGDVIYISGKKPQGVLNFGDGGIAFEKKKVSYLRYKRISRVLVKLSDNMSYSEQIVNSSAVDDGINRVRYLNASPESTGAFSDAQRLIDKGERQSLSVQLECPEFLGNVLGKKASVQGIDKLLYVTQVKYTLSQSGEKTILGLMRKEDYQCG